MTKGNPPHSEEFDGTVPAKKVTSRATVRPPEESASQDPEAQAEAILEESESRVGQGFSASKPED